MRALRILGIALTTLRVIDSLKEGLPVEVGPAVKSTATVAVAVGVAYPFADTWPERLLLAGASAGLASLLHDGQTLLRVMTDGYIAGIVKKAKANTLHG